MSENRTEVALGAVVIAGAVAFLRYAGQVTGLTGAARTGYEVVASFRSADGVTVGTDVRLAGVRIGSVSQITLNTQSFEADVRMSLRDDLRLPDDSTAIVATEGLLGGTYLEIQPGGSPFDIDPGGRILDTQSAVSVITLLMRFVTGSSDSTTDAGADTTDSQP